MDDTRIQTAKTEAHEAMVELDSDQPNIGRAVALLDDSRNGIVDVVEGGLSGGCSKADLNQLDSARMYINKAISMLTRSSSPPEWMFSSVQQFIGAATTHLQVVLSGNVVPLHRTRPKHPGGGAA